MPQEPADSNEKLSMIPTAHVSRNAVLELVLSQALSGTDWEDCCQEVMQRYAISKQDLDTALKRRASVLMYRSMVTSIVCLIPLSMYLDYSHQLMHYKYPVATLLTLNSILPAQCLSLLLLKHCHRARVYIPCGRFYLIQFSLTLSLMAMAFTWAFHGIAPGCEVWLYVLPAPVYFGSNFLLMSVERIMSQLPAPTFKSQQTLSTEAKEY